MKKLIILFVFTITVNSLLFSQSFKTFISDTANYYYRVSSTIYEENNTYSFFLTKCLRDSMNYGNLNYIQLDNAGNVITDTILFPEIKFQATCVMKSNNNFYYFLINHINKTDSLNGRIYKLDTVLKIIKQKNLPYYGDSTFYAYDIIEVENKNIVFNLGQYTTGVWGTSFMYKTNENLDSLNSNQFPFITNTIIYDTINSNYIAIPLALPDTIFAYISYDLNLDSVQLAPNYLPQFLSRFQNSLLLLSNGKKIYSNTSGDGDFYMGIYLFEKDMNILNYRLLANDAYPGEVKNLSFVNNSKYIYFIGTTNYMAYPEDSNSIILTRIDTNYLFIDYKRFFHNDRVLRPFFMETTSDNGCITIGHLGYVGANYGIQSVFIIKFDSLGNLVWSQGVELEERIALVYPNPATNTLYVNNSIINQKTDFTIYDMQGRKMLSKPLQSIENSFDISALPAGVYIYRITNKEKTLQTGKIVKE